MKYRGDRLLLGIQSSGLPEELVIRNGEGKQINLTVDITCSFSVPSPWTHITSTQTWFRSPTQFDACHSFSLYCYGKHFTLVSMVLSPHSYSSLGHFYNTSVLLLCHDICVCSSLLPVLLWLAFSIFSDISEIILSLHSHLHLLLLLLIVML